MAQEERKEISFEEWVKRFNEDLVKACGQAGVPTENVDRVLLMMIFRELRWLHEQFDWIYPQLRLLLKQDVRAQKRVLRELK